MFRAADGSLHDSDQAATKHEQECATRELLRGVAEEIRAPYENVDDMAQQLHENRYRLAALVDAWRASGEVEMAR